LHPAQCRALCACYAFFLEGFSSRCRRLSNFVEKALKSCRDVLTTPATGQGLLNYFLVRSTAAPYRRTKWRAPAFLEEIQLRSFAASSRAETAPR